MLGQQQYGTRMHLQDLAGNTDLQSYPQPDLHWLRENLSPGRPPAIVIIEHILMEGNTSKGGR